MWYEVPIPTSVEEYILFTSEEDILSAMDKVPSRYKVPIPTSGGMYSILRSEGDIIGQG